MKPDAYQFQSGMLESWQEPKKRSLSFRSLKNAPDQEQILTIGLRRTSVRLDGQEFEPVVLLTELNKIGGRHGILQEIWSSPDLLG